MSTYHHGPEHGVDSDGACHGTNGHERVLILVMMLMIVMVMVVMMMILAMVITVVNCNSHSKSLLLNAWFWSTPYSFRIDSHCVSARIQFPLPCTRLFGSVVLLLTATTACLLYLQQCFAEDQAQGTQGEERKPPVQLR